MIMELNLTKSPHQQHISHLVCSRQYILHEEYRDQLTTRILHKLVLQPTMTFKKVWKKESTKPVCIGLDRRMYFNNHTECYFNDGYKGLPHCLYHLSQEQNSKIVSAMLYFCHIRQKPVTSEEKEVCLLTLTSDGFLKLINADTGTILRSIYLSTSIQFKYLSWADYLHSIQVKSIHSKPHQVGTNSGRVMSLIVFKIHPIELIAYMHIHKKIFGDNIRDVSLTEDLLLVLSSQHCQYYSFQWILDNCTIATVKLGISYQSNDTTVYTPGTFPNSIPTTINITELPPLLFQTQCNSEVGVHFGGSPHVYIHNPKPAACNEFHVRTLRSGQLIGTLSTDNVAFHHDVASFHFEDYQRILHISGCTLMCYRLTTNGLTLQYLTNFKALKTEQDTEVPQVSSRGRIIKRKKPEPAYYGDFVSAIQDLDHENELDLLYTVITLPEGEETVAQLCFLDDNTGKITKTVPLPTWNPAESNSIYYELDCLIHVAGNICYFYRLTRETSSLTDNSH